MELPKVVLFMLTATASIRMSAGMQQQQSPHSSNARRGAKFLEGKARYDTMEDIVSPQGLRDLARLQALRTPGSLRYQSSWRHVVGKSIDSIRFHLSQNLPYPADADSFGNLFFNLGTAADRGEMPSFADPGSRSGYALEFFCRARLLTDILFEKCNPSSVCYQPDVTECALSQKMGHTTDDPEHNAANKTVNVVSLGGGPGYDYVGVLLADMVGNAGFGKTTIKGTIFDYEEGWGDLVEAMDTAVNLALLNDDNLSSVAWGGGCDITKPLSDLSNAACLEKVPTTDLFICQYCVAENANRLRDSDFCFFADLFDQAADDTIFVFTEVTPRVWPDFVDLIQQHQGDKQGFRLDFLRGMRGNGQQMILQKKEGAVFSPEELSVCETFRNLQQAHRRKIDNGFKRQPKKIPGSKPSIDAFG